MSEKLGRTLANSILESVIICIPLITRMVTTDKEYLSLRSKTKLGKVLGNQEECQIRTLAQLLLAVWIQTAFLYLFETARILS